MLQRRQASAVDKFLREQFVRHHLFRLIEFKSTSPVGERHADHLVRVLEPKLNHLVQTPWRRLFESIERCVLANLGNLLSDSVYLLEVAVVHQIFRMITNVPNSSLPKTRMLRTARRTRKVDDRSLIIHPSCEVSVGTILPRSSWVVTSLRPESVVVRRAAHDGCVLLLNRLHTGEERPQEGQVVCDVVSQQLHNRGVEAAAIWTLLHTILFADLVQEIFCTSRTTNLMHLFLPKLAVAANISDMGALFLIKSCPGPCIQAAFHYFPFYLFDDPVPVPHAYDLSCTLVYDRFGVKRLFRSRLEIEKDVGVHRNAL